MAEELRISLLRLLLALFTDLVVVVGGEGIGGGGWDGRGGIRVWFFDLACCLPIAGGGWDGEGGGRFGGRGARFWFSDLVFFLRFADARAAEITVLVMEGTWPPERPSLSSGLSADDE